jgi:hypothetical protein
MKQRGGNGRAPRYCMKLPSKNRASFLKPALVKSRLSKPGDDDVCCVCTRLRARINGTLDWR